LILRLMQCDSEMAPVVCVTQLIAEFAKYQIAFAWLGQVTIAAVIAKIRHDCWMSEVRKSGRWTQSR